MSTADERLVFMLEARIKEFEKRLLAAQKATDKRARGIEKRTETMASRMKASMAVAGAAMGAAMGAVGVAASLSTQGVADLIRSMADMKAEAKQAGVAVVPFQELGYAAKQSRVSMDALTDGLKEMALRADEFILTGAGGGAEAFQRLGYTAEELQEKLKQPDLLFEEIIDKLKRLDTASQIRIADEIFGGTGGEQFVRFLDKGQKSIQDMRSEAHDLGIVMDEGMVDKAEEAAKKFDKLATVIEGRLKSGIVSVAESFDEWAASVKEFISWLDGTKFGQAQKWLMDNTAIGQGMKAGALLQQAVTGVGPYTMPTPATDTTALKRAFDQGRKPGDVPAFDDWLSRKDEAKARRQAGTDPGEKDKKAGTTPGQRFEASIDSLREEIRMLEKEQEALGKSTYEAARLTTEQKLLEEARRAGVEISPEIQKQIAAEADAYAQAAAKFEDAQEAMARADELRGYLGSEMSAGISDLITGARTLDDVVKDLTSSLMDAVIQATLLGEGPLASVLGGGAGGGGLIGSLLKGVGFADGGYTGNGGKYDPAGIVHRGEYVFDKAATARLGAGNLEALRKGKNLPGFASGGAVGIPATLKAPPSMAGAMGGRAMSSQQSFNLATDIKIDARGANMSEDQIRAVIAPMLAQNNKQMAKALPDLVNKQRARMTQAEKAYY